METQRRPSVAFFIQYYAVLAFAFVWIQFPYVRDRTSPANVSLFYALCAFGVCYVTMRAYLVLGRRVGEGWEYPWLFIDIGLITAATYLTGGIRSEAALMYFSPIATSSIQHRTRRTLAAGLATAVAYVPATWPSQTAPDYVARLITHVFVILLASALAVHYARREAARVEEMARLREKVALADYRSRLSQEMHDGIQHYLVTLAARMDLARSLADTQPTRAAQIVAGLRLIVRQAADELRYLVRRLRSPAIERQGFVDALKEHLSIFAERSSIAAPLEIEGPATALSADIEQAAFRIVQEALTNAEKYAQATEMKVRLRFEPDVFECVVADNGVGFEPSCAAQEPGAEGGFGLSNMKGRAESVEGRLEVTSAPGRGTTITFTVPIQSRPKPAAA